jgi:hypothetical protein
MLMISPGAAAAILKGEIVPGPPVSWANGA